MNEEKLAVSLILETYVHADHLSAAPYLKKSLGTTVAIGAHITDVQGVFRDIFNLGASFPADGRQFDRLLADGETLDVGDLSISCMHTPGHTPACMTYVIGDAAFVGGYDVYARLWYRPVRLSWRRRGDALPVHAEDTGSSTGDAHFRVP